MNTMRGERRRHGAGATGDAGPAGRVVDTKDAPCTDEDARLTMALTTAGDHAGARWPER
jgi:hypothetical protein